ncbi:hypothetical protein BGX38DRAFT_1142648 [Terfezia claveryi]|nr:hypothetical protein BGX38DRAFT_1142648 [Terfezia claveryi]
MLLEHLPWPYNISDYGSCRRGDCYIEDNSDKNATVSVLVTQKQTGTKTETKLETRTTIISVPVAKKQTRTKTETKLETRTLIITPDKTTRDCTSTSVATTVTVLPKILMNNEKECTQNEVSSRRINTIENLYRSRNQTNRSHNNGEPELLTMDRLGLRKYAVAKRLNISERPWGLGDG